MMSPYLRSVVAQLRQISKPIASLRNYSADVWMAAGEKFRTRVVGLVTGCGSGYFVFGGMASTYKENEEEKLRKSEESVKQKEKDTSDLVASLRKSKLR